MLPGHRQLGGALQGCVVNVLPVRFPWLSLLHILQVNKIRECPQEPSVLVTHTDAPELYVWSTERQHNRQGDTVSGQGSVSLRASRFPPAQDVPLRLYRTLLEHA